MAEYLRDLAERLMAGGFLGAPLPALGHRSDLGDDKLVVDHVVSGLVHQLVIERELVVT
jgi:hypothetical protein